MAGRRHRPNLPRFRGRRLVGAIAVPLVAAALVTIPAEPAAHAALNGLTNFEIDANTVVNGPSPPSGGAGIDWANAALFLQDVGQPTELCTGDDPTIVDGKLNGFDPFAPNPHPGIVNGKDDLCQAFTAWEPVNVTTAGVTTVHYVLYGGWRRNAVTGDMSFFVPLIGGPTKSAVTLVQFNFDPSAGGSTTVGLLQWNGSSWVTKAAPASAFQGIAEPGTSPAFGEFAVDLTAAGVLPATQTCASLVSDYVITRPGNGNADLADYLAVPPVQISNCSTVQITKTTTPAISSPPVDFAYTLDRVDGGPVQDSSVLTPPNTDANPSNTKIVGTLTVPTAPTDVFTNIFTAGSYRLVENLPPPAPWLHQSIVCNYFNPAILDDNNKATPATATLTNPDGTWSGQTFTVAPTGLLPAGVTVAATCTISNHAPSLTLAKQVVNTVGNAAATADMWTLSATPAPGTAIDFGPGSESGVTRVVAPSTYTLAETPNAGNPPPLGYTAGAWSCVDAANNSVPVTGGNQVVIGATANITCTITNTAADLARLTLHKIVVGGTATVPQFTLTASQGGTGGAIDGNPISGIDGSTSVTLRPVKRGSFALGETGPPGYVPSWVCTNGAGTVVSITNGVEIPAAFTNPNQLVVSCTVTNTTTTLDIDVSAAAVNPAGRSHTFTLTAHRVDTAAPLPGALLNLTFSDPALVTGNTCQTAPGTDANGQCTITVSSAAPGSFVLTVNGFTNQGPNGPLPGTAFTLPVPVSTTKLWTTYRVEGESAVNLVGDSEHTFTLRGFQSDGTGESPLPGGSVIAYTWSGAGPVSPPGQCTVDASGTCDVTVSAGTTGPESGTLTVTSITVSLPDGSGGSTSYTLSAGDVALSAPLPVLTKSWVGFRVRVEPSSQVNLVGQPHTFTVTAEFATTPGVWQPVNGGTVALTWASSVANPDASSTCPVLSAAGTCTFTVVPTTPLEPGIGVFTITGLSAPGVTIGGQTTIITEPIEGAALDLSAATAQKTWVLVDVTITPGVDNLAGESHTFTVQVTGFDGDGPFPDGTGVPGAVVTSSVVSAVGGAAVTGNTCLTGTDANGQCTITVSNTGSGSIVLQLEQVTVTIDGTPFTIDLTPGARGLRSDAILPIRTDKVWWQYRVRLSDSAINPLGVTHTFTATVERTNDGAATWQSVPDGAHLDFVWIDPNAVSQVDPSSTCLTTGTVGGTCTFVVSSTAATTGTLNIRGIVDTFLDRNRDGLTGGPTDPIPDPVEFANEIVDIPASAFGPGSLLTARKTWLNFTVDVSSPAENPVGTDHTFTLTVRFSAGGATGFLPVAPGTTMTYAWSGPAGSAEDTTRSTCDPPNGPGTDINGQCTVVIDSPIVPGEGTLTITGIASTEIPQPPRPVTFPFQTPGTTTKTWIAYRAAISPSATNLAGTPHTFTVTVQQDRGDGNGFVTVPDGTTIAVALTDPTKLTGSTCTGGTVAGACTITVASNTPGAVTVQPGAITVSLLDGTGARVPVVVPPGSPAYATPGSATKTWVAVDVSVTPPTATNLVGQSHTFTAHVGVIGADGTTPAPDGAKVAWAAFDGPGTLDTDATTCDTTGTVAGACDIVFTNDGTPGSGTLTITSVTFTANGQTFTVDLTAGGPAQATPPPITATKTWAAYAVTITPSANNPVGTQHNFTITATVDNGTTTVPAAGATIAFTWTGAGTLLTPSPCTTSASGTCIVSVTSTTAGAGTLTVTSLTDSGGAVVDLTISGAPGQAAGQVVPLTASKTWLQYRVLLDTAATNLTGQPHTFNATVQQSAVAVPLPGDWTAVPDGTTLTASTSGPGTLDPASTCLTGGTAGGTCTFVVHDAGPGTLDLTVTAINATTVDGVAFTNIALTDPATTSKTWVGAAVSVTPATATNLVGQTHTFTVHVDVIGADGTTTPQPAPNGTTVTWTFNGPGTVAAAATTCDTLGTINGDCAIVFTNDGTPGSGTLTITSVTFTANGQTLTIDLSTPGAPGQATPPPITATKTWGAYAVTITPSANNPVGTQHNFTITATVDNGTTTSPAAGATITYTWTGAGTATPPNTCTTDASGTCVVSVTSPAAGTGTLTVTSLTDSAGAFVDLTTLGAPGQAAGQDVPLTASKTWLQYRVLLDTAATNLTGQPHTFNATVQQSALADPTDTDWTPVPNGTTLKATSTGEGTLDPASTCLTVGTTAGTCTLVVHDNGPGTLDLTVTAINATTVDGVAFTNIALTTPAATSKTWVGADVSITPPSATNLVGQTHTFNIHVDVIGADGTTTPQPAPNGTAVTWTFTGPGSLDTGTTTCTTPGTIAGNCDIVFTNDGTPGSGTLTIKSVTFTVNGQTLTIDLNTPGAPGQVTPPPITATKTWGAYAVTITPSAINPVGTQHDFVITANVDNGTTTTPAAGATIDFTWTGAGTLLTPSPCTTGANGTCIVSVTSSTAGTGTLTVTSLTDSAGAVVDLTIPGAPGQAAGQDVPVTTTKTWLQYRVLLDTTTATNLVDVPHTFRATVQQSALANPTPADWSPVLDGTILTASTSGEGALDPASTCLAGGTSGGICTLVVRDAGPGTLDLTVTAIGSTMIGGVAFTDIALSSPATASKTWISAAVSVTPAAATNLVGQSHTFTVHVNVIGADGTTTPQPAPDGTIVTWTFNGPGTVSAGATTCDTTGTVAGTCTITLTNNGTAGAGTLTITSVTFTVNGQPFTVDLATVGAPGQGTPPPITATKTWDNYRVTVTPTAATNIVGEPHTFTVLVEHDTGTGFQPLADAPVALSTSGTAVPNDPVPTSCVTDSAGICTVTITSSVPGTLTLTATYEAASDAGAESFTGSGNKVWVPGWALTIAKASHVTGSTQLFAFETDGPPPLAAQSFSLAIGQSQSFERLRAGTYTIEELTDAAHLPPPWRLQSLACTGLSDDATAVIEGALATLTLPPPNPGGAITCTYTNERMNLFVHKTSGGVTPVAGGDPFDYTITVGNDGSVATSSPITVTDTLGAGLVFAGAARPPAGGTCAPPVGQVLTCTLTAPIPPGGTVQIVVPARALTSAASTVVNNVKIDSDEDVLCPDGTCPPPPTCPAPGQTVALAAARSGGDPSDNQACVHTAVTPAGSSVGPESGGEPTTVPPPAESSSGSSTGVIPFTGSTTFPLTVGALCLLVGLGISLFVRRRRAHRSA